MSTTKVGQPSEQIAGMKAATVSLSGRVGEDARLAHDYEVIWNGRGSLPQQVIDAAWWAQISVHAESPLMTHAPGKHDYPTAKEIAKANLVTADGWCRYAPPTVTATRAYTPRSRERGEARSLVGVPKDRCPCGAVLTAAMQRNGMRRCRACRKANPGQVTREVAA